MFCRCMVDSHERRDRARGLCVGKSQEQRLPLEVTCHDTYKMSGQERVNHILPASALETTICFQAS
jgi:hypothetical protein